MAAKSLGRRQCCAKANEGHCASHGRARPKESRDHDSQAQQN
jgi:hypothetical protein